MWHSIAAMKYFRITLLLFLLCAFLCCSHAQNNDSALFRMVIRTEPPTLDPNLATDNISNMMLTNLFEGLTCFDIELKVHPGNASHWTVSDDGRIYTFYLNKNYKWSDGVPVTAQHYVDSWQRLLDPKIGSKYAYFLYNLMGAREFNEGKNHDANSVGVKALADDVLQVTLTEPAAYFPMITTYMVTFPIRQDLLNKNSQTYSEAKGYVGNGPFMLTKWVHDSHLELKKNPYYGGEIKPTLERVDVHIMPEFVTSLALYLRGDLDYVELPPMAIRKYKDRKDLQQLNLLATFYFGFNVTKAPFDEVRVRRAFAMALDKSRIPGLLMGGQQPTNSFVPKGMQGFEPDIGIPFDPHKARALLADDIKAGHFKEVSLHYNNDPRNAKVAEWAQEEWQKNLGIHVDIVNEEWKSYLNRLNNNPPEMFRMGWGADYPDPDNFMNQFTSYSDNNYTHYKSPAYDALVKEAASLADMNARLKIYARLQKMLLEDVVALVPIFTDTRTYLVNPALAPLPINPLEVVDMKLVRKKSF